MKSPKIFHFLRQIQNIALFILILFFNIFFPAASLHFSGSCFFFFCLHTKHYLTSLIPNSNLILRGLRIGCDASFYFFTVKKEFIYLLFLV